MPFHWLNNQGVESSAGYVLQRMHRFYYHYTEGERVVQVIVEPGIQREELFLDKKAKWQPPHDAEQIPTRKLIAIQRNISDALTFMSIPHVFKDK